MNAAFQYPFQPQPPSRPKATGGKHGPITSLPLTCLEDEGSKTVANYNPPVRLTILEHTSTRPKIKPCVVNVPSLSTAHNYITAKKPGLVALQALNNNNISVLNLNHVTITSSLNHSSVNTTPSVINSNVNGNSSNNNDNSIASLTTTVSNLNSTSSTENNNYLLNSETAADTSIECSTTQTTNEQPSDQHDDQLSSLEIKQASSNIQSDANIIPDLTSECKVLTSLNSLAENNDTFPNDFVNSVVKDIPELSPTSSNDQPFNSLSNFAYEHDHDYESVSSPCSSTASGPIYVRPAGFIHHSQEIEIPNVKNKLKKKRYLASLDTVREGYKKREATPPKLKPKREPLPMKLRALPQSFWQQPNVAHQVSPATLFLPPLLNKDTEEVMMDVRPVTPPEERDITKRALAPERKVIVTNTDLLFKLFDGIKEGKKSNSSFKSRAIKARKLVPRSNTKGLLLGNDPYLVDAVTEKIFPQLTLEGSRHSLGGGNTSLQLITLKEGDRTVTLPSLSLEQNYPQMLSELVMHI